MFVVTQKLKILKQPLKVLNNRLFADVEHRAFISQRSLMETQHKLDLDPHNVELATLEKTINEATILLKKAKLSFMHQKAKVGWMREADDNINYFLSALKARRSYNKFLAINDIEGHHWMGPEDIEGAFLN
ncbi:hypothetical protein vseg_007956 [Gypsophila vaccaria]